MLRCQIITDLSNPHEPLLRHLVFTAKAVREGFEQTLTAAGGSLGTWIVLSALSDDGVVSQTDKLWSITPVIYAWFVTVKSDLDPRMVLMSVLATIWGVGYRLRDREMS